MEPNAVANKEIHDLSKIGTIYYKERAEEIYKQMKKLTLMNSVMNYIFIVVDNA